MLTWITMSLCDHQGPTCVHSFMLTWITQTTITMTDWITKNPDVIIYLLLTGDTCATVLEVGLVIHVLEAVIYVDIKIATTQVGIRTLTPTYVHIVAT